MIENPLRALFPQFTQANPVVYLDSAATSHKPQSVIDRTTEFYTAENSNVHRSSHQMAAHTTAQFEAVRKQVQQFIGAANSKEIIWTKGTTESINLVAACLTAQQLKPGSELLVSGLEHHANLVPWQQVAQRFSLSLKIMPVDKQGRLELNQALRLINTNTALVAIAQVSNALGNINPIAAIIAKAKTVGALTLVDGAQAVAHLKVNVQDLGCDFYVFSGHKMYGPTGIGVLYGKQTLLESLPPYQFGGEMIEHVSYQHSSFQTLPYKYEAGTPNIAGVMGLGAALNFMHEHRDVIDDIENQLYRYLINGLSQISGLRLWGEVDNSVAVQSFTVEGLSQQDLVILLNQQNIAIRAGHHCAMPLMQTLGIEGTLRVSLACYNTFDEIDYFLQALKSAITQLSTTPMQVKSGAFEPINVSETTTVKPLASQIKAARGWDQVYRQIMLAGRDLGRLPDTLKSAEYQVFGCESQVWLKCELHNNQLSLQGDSPSKIVRGLLAIIFEVLVEQTPEQIMQFKLNEYLADLGLAHHLSQSRGNGLMAVVEKINHFCETHLI
ncbi:SufS family cysteine desulfurase [Paraglaciecola hydrolytica]|uniref:cysteine desulfurase n=1 Tax=Paraglaciecola hydrolytica TaxID=1799789 RepID=A0A136A0K6_9ALTE|nr:SufS family cysteine desulfurase [Paraglaciecola hydrolytica]KXI28752.1 cysteine desulfurase [Paraglaciecola hydrolytica]